MIRERPGTKPLHVLEVALMWPPETFLQWRFRGLARRGFRITVGSHAPLSSAATVDGATLLPLPDWEDPRRRRVVAGIALGAVRLLVTSPRRLRRLLVGSWKAWRRSADAPGSPRQRRWKALARLRSFLILARLRPDVVHFEWESAAVAHLPLLDVWRCRMVVSCHGGLLVMMHTPLDKETADGLAEAFQAAAAVHCVSAAVRREALRHDVDPAKLHLITTAVDPDLFRPRPDRDRTGGPLRVVTVGWMKWLKGFEYAVQAVSELIRRGVPVRLDVLGGEPPQASGQPGDRARILHAIEELRLESHVQLHGQVESADVLDHLQRSDVLLHPSLSEGLPTVVLEAMACALPVVVTDCGGVREAVTDGVEGFVVPPRAPWRMAAALESLSRDAGLRQRMGTAGRTRIEAEFTLDRQVEAFSRLYERVTNGAAAPRTRSAPPPARPGSQGATSRP